MNFSSKQKTMPIHDIDSARLDAMQAKLDMQAMDIEVLKKCPNMYLDRIELMQADLDIAEQAIATQYEMIEKLTNKLAMYIEYDERNSVRIDELTVKVNSLTFKVDKYHSIPEIKERLAKIEGMYKSICDYDASADKAISNHQEILETMQRRLDSFVKYDHGTAERLDSLEKRLAALSNYDDITTNTVNELCKDVARLACRTNDIEVNLLELEQ